MSAFVQNAYTRLLLALLGSSFSSLLLFAINPKNHEFTYLPGNLFLAWLAVGATLWLRYIARRRQWSTWQGIIISFVWFFFLPNTFYMISDFVHLATDSHDNLLFDVAMFTSFILNGLVLGLLSLCIIHNELLRRLSRNLAFITIEFVILVCSFGIYIGRELRWNSWDIVANFPAVVIDVSDRVLHLPSHPQTLPMTFSFFVLLSSIYIIVWQVSNQRTGR